MNEIQIVLLLPIKQIHFVREGPTPKGGYRVAYALGDDGQTITREWFLFHGWCDGVELIPSSDAPMVRTDSIALNRPTTSFDPRLVVIVPRKPVRLLERWTTYHNDHPRVITDSFFNRLKHLLRSI